MGTSISLYESLNPSENPKDETCAYVTRTGHRCPRKPVEDETLCVLHGASVARAQEQVKRKLVALQEKSVAVIEELFLEGDDKVRLAAATAVLDRTGLGPKSTIALDTVPDLANMSIEDLAKELDTLAKTARDEATRQRMNEALMKKNSASDSTH